jgi:antitoxin protein of toxin-antitoxin system
LSPAKYDAGKREGRMGFLDKAKDLLSQNADKVEMAIDKAGEFVDEKTQGKYTDTIHQVQDQARKATGAAGPGDQQN